MKAYHWAGIALFVLIVLAVVIAFPLWISMQPRAAVDRGNLALSGQTLVEELRCRSCHTIDGQGGINAPVLDGVTQRYEREVIHRWVTDPLSVDRATRMPGFRLTGDEFDALYAYLSTLEMPVQ